MELPLTSAVYHILLALADGERHGYAIMQEIEEMTDGKLNIGAGTLYRSIKKMLVEDLIAEVDIDDEEDERRRYYQLTGKGRQLALDETERLAQIVNFANRSLGTSS